MNELDAHVTRIVGSVVASPQRRLAMRQELLSHLDQVYADEAARHSSQTEAIEASIRRLGDADQLIQELQSSVPFRDIVGRAFRWAVICLILEIFLALPLLAVSTLDAFVPTEPSLVTYAEQVHAARFRLMLTTMLSSQVMIAVFVFALTLLYFWQQRLIRLSRRPFLVLTLGAATTGLVVLAGGLLLNRTATGEMIVSVSYFVRWTYIAIAAALAVSVLPPIIGSQLRRYRSWRQWHVLTTDSSNGSETDAGGKLAMS